MKNFTEYFSELNYAISRLDHASMEAAFNAIDNAHLLFIMGNGGSAASADHWVCDFMKGINEDTELSARAISLTSNGPLITAIANDVGYDHIFERQLMYHHCTFGDVVLAISASGNSKNILNGLYRAKKLGATTIAFTGFTGGEAAAMADINVHVPAHNYGIVEDIHMMILHAISQRIRAAGATDPKKIRL
jgi:phosphoheptose isomerase